MNSQSKHCVFFQVHDNTTKIRRLIETAQAHFKTREALLIFTEDAKAQLFVDNLLWKTGFLPHAATDLETADWIVITAAKKNINKAKAAFNLCPTPLLIEENFRILYEFEDLTNPAKKNFSSLRFDAYKSAGFLIEARV